MIVAVAIISGFSVPTSAAAASADDFDPGFLISDPLFYDGDAMSETDIQSFFNAKIGACTNGQCLNVLSVTAPSRARQVSSTTGQLVCEAIEGGVLTAAQIIYRAQIACGISAKVILVTLQKEQGLTTSRAPSQYALDRAMGMNCPDTAPCAVNTLGFANQVMAGTAQLKIYKAARFGRQPGSQYVQYHPNAACGGTTVNVQNFATAALYNYTPYQPNAAALRNLYGSGDACSSYGNRNFWRYYTDWFGSTDGTPLSAPDIGSHVLALSSAGDLIAYRGDGRGGWLRTRTVDAALGGATRVYGAGDLDGDTHRDLVTVRADGSAWMHLGDGAWKFTSGASLQSVIPAGRSVVAPGDFTGDGAPDLMSIDTSGVLWLHVNTGRGAFAPQRAIGNGWGALTAVTAAGDFDGDRRSDLIGRDAAGNLHLYRGDGFGSWLGSRVIGYGWANFTSIFSSGDFTGDGAVDVFARDDAGRLALFQGNGAGGWRSGGFIGQGWATFVDVAGIGAQASVIPFADTAGVGDIDADGRRDVVGVGSDGAVTVFRGDGTGAWRGVAASVARWPAPRAILGAGDFDGTGSRDLIVVTAEGVMLVVPHAPAGGLGEARQIGQGWTTILPVGAGDFDGDAKPDVLARTDDGLLFLYPGTGAGGFGTPRQVGNGWTTMTALFSPGDFTGDGTLDLISRTGDGRLLLYSGNGDATWQPGAPIGVGWAGFDTLFSPGDFTGDRFADVIARATDGTLWLYSGNGRGGWLGGRQIGWGWGGFSRIA